uniref:tRNA-synt_1 domain-containing protein n=1 Tax=Heterorhabditis bacteriophora TaxID=37862 RepID=A0A1I7WNZ6_HETBA
MSLTVKQGSKKTVFFPLKERYWIKSWQLVVDSISCMNGNYYKRENRCFGVRFRPGWDCHGLPIELKITKNVQVEMNTGKSPVEIRSLARDVANESIGKQMNSFKRWGISGDWSNPYKTMDTEYMSMQLRLFGNMIEKGLVYRSFKPVYWLVVELFYFNCIPSDGVLEGVDQFRGWFQSLLLTATAINDFVPYKRIHVHGFCVDHSNVKMSKSTGNVVDPETITDGSLRQKALGADGLRLWVALVGAENADESRIGDDVLLEIERKIFYLYIYMDFIFQCRDNCINIDYIAYFCCYFHIL